MSSGCTAQTWGAPGDSALRGSWTPARRPLAVSRGTQRRPTVQQAFGHLGAHLHPWGRLGEPFPVGSVPLPSRAGSLSPLLFPLPSNPCFFLPSPFPPAGPAPTSDSPSLAVGNQPGVKEHKENPARSSISDADGDGPLLEGLGDGSAGGLLRLAATLLLLLLLWLLRLLRVPRILSSALPCLGFL